MPAGSLVLSLPMPACHNRNRESAMWKKLLLGGAGQVGAGILGLVGYIQMTWEKTYDDVPYPQR